MSNIITATWSLEWLYQFTLSSGHTDKEDEVFGMKGGERSSGADMWCPRCVCSDTAVICSRWRKVALKAVSVNEITWEDPGPWQKSSLLPHFRGGHQGQETEKGGLSQEVGRRRIRTVSQGLPWWRGG